MTEDHSGDNSKTIEVKREELQRFRHELLADVDAKLTSFVNSLGRHNEAPVERNGVLPQESHRPRQSEMIEKKFVIRKSLLTELFETEHIRTIYHIFVAVLVLLILSSMVKDIFMWSSLDFKFEMIRWCFGGMPIVITIWLSMFSATLAVYPVFQYWAYRPSTGFLDKCWCLAYVAYMIGFLVIPVQYLIHYDLPIASSMIVACEQVRLVMKVHAFVRSCASKALHYKAVASKKDDSSDTAVVGLSPCPDFEVFLYFLFAPTLVYRDSYPRTRTINWNYVVTNFAQVVACTTYVYYVFAHFCVPVFRNFNADHISLKAFILSVFSCILPGTLCLFLGFFAVLHSWLNAHAEMLRFGDRMFYKDWWNSTSFSNYYRTWNVVVHDWLYTYVYGDVCKVMGHTSQKAALVLVFLLSAIVHEYIVVIALRFFYPVMFIEFFIFGVVIMFLTKKRRNRGWNVLMWISLFTGCGLMMCLYSMEWYARKNCPPAYNNFLDRIVPRSWSCDGIVAG